MHQNSFREHMIEDFQHAPDPLKTAACEIALYCLGELIQRFLQLTPEKMPQPKVMATHRASVPRRTSLSRRASPFPPYSSDGFCGHRFSIADRLSIGL